VYEKDQEFLALTKTIKQEDNEYYLFLLEAYKSTDNIKLIKQLLNDMFGSSKDNNSKEKV